MEAIEELKKKPRREWTEEDKAKSKGMIGKILRTLGKAGVAIVTAIFAFAMWMFSKGKEKNSELDQTYIVKSEEKPEGFLNESTDEASFMEETTFKEDKNNAME
jgi:hypothetical protein